MIQDATSRTNDSGSPRARSTSAAGLVAQAADQHAVLAARFEVLDDERERLAHDPAPVDDHAVLASQDKPGVLEVHQLRLRDVDGELLVMPLTPGRAACLVPPGAPGPARVVVVVGGVRDGPERLAVALIAGRRAHRGPEQLVRARQRHPPAHRASTSLARSRYA